RAPLDCRILGCMLVDAVVSCVTRIFLFFSSRRRHTISKRDWSSDVCSSDLLIAMLLRGDVHSPMRSRDVRRLPCSDHLKEVIHRSEERRVGKECRSRWWPYQ